MLNTIKKIGLGISILSLFLCPINVYAQKPVQNGDLVVVKQEQNEEEDKFEKISLGEYRITHYCNCASCCGVWSGGPTASGVMPQANLTIATGHEFDFGTQIMINDIIYIVQDRGVGNGCIDIYCDSHTEASNRGLYYTQIFLIKEKGIDIVNYANKFVGNPYIYGGNSLTEGCDCSHFVWNVLKDTGYFDGEYMPSYSWRSFGQKVDSLQQARAGDIVIYSGHIAIYDGHGKIIQAQNSANGITNNRQVECSAILAIRRFTKE